MLRLLRSASPRAGRSGADISFSEKHGPAGPAAPAVEVGKLLGRLPRHGSEAALRESDRKQSDDGDVLGHPEVVGELLLEHVMHRRRRGAEIRPATLCLTSASLRIDPDARVLHRAGAPIPGLFAAGEATGGVLGERYMGSGNSLANCATMGRVAGTRAGSSDPG